AVQVVVHDDVVELVLEGELLQCDRKALLDLPPALGRPVAEAALELLQAGRLDEDGHRAGHLVADDERAVRLEVEQRHAALAADAVDLRAERAVAWPPGMRDVLQEGAFPDE